MITKPKRFTPAYAGNTTGPAGHALPHRVHPRIRGEYSGVRCLAGSAKGSPPHTRGILILDILAGGHGRFTPAYAGNTACHF